VNELHTNIFLWYSRFDVVVGILAGTDVFLTVNQNEKKAAAIVMERATYLECCQDKNSTSLHSPGGKLYRFLQHYNKALILLRKSLGSGEEHRIKACAAWW
jgi:hypothetical protein